MMSRFDLLICLFILTTLSGCKKIDIPNKETKPDEQQVTLRLLMPQNSSNLGTYAISEIDQNSIHGLDVLAFRVADDGKEYYAYHKKAVLLRPGDNATTIDFHVDLLKSTDKFRFVLIANAATQLQTALNGLAANAEKETLMTRMEYGVTTKWNAGSSGNFTPLPMWGESMMIDGINNNTQKFSVNMLRSLAAIDVKVTANDFVMTQVYVYNMSGKGLIAPVGGNYDAAEYKVKAPSIPAGTNKLVAQPYTSATNTLAGEIFLFESTAPGNTGDSNATGLVIAGKYAGSSDITYYRVELTDDQQKLLPVLRNHRYAIDITKVHAAGFSSQALAWASKPVNMTATVTAWNETSVADANIPAVQYLKVAIPKVELSGLQGQTTFTIWTNAPTPAVNLDLPTWLVKLDEDRDGDKITYSFHVDENNSATAVRSSTIGVRVGSIIGKLEVKQGARPIDLGSGFGFYVFAGDVPDAGFWYKVANVEKSISSPLDASLTQKSGDPYPESCVAIWGQGARLPTFTELRQLMPTDANARKEIYKTISDAGGTALLDNAIDLWIYMSSSARPFYADQYRAIKAGGAAEENFYSKSGGWNNQWYGNSRGRCVLSK
ncbi:hypothetical protein HMPREF0765_2656 [Sphingobacterium spiritivorum ATCC 33300]|uniref:BACON domain-containing protein n=1 Tax=Sphingobacterium spiritivorum ATCC 33300 TaxID=525372 RepID=C2FZA0_SPHSI|nr:BACON domain-containing protein [Sphingobacterium spiritivorum]EEI91709.1 hypothetical protein HMPREF0765_2656 [Sphingobacterium spiritivorum ATCC 33300]QQS97092.1 BACON domain-containing protein [Sphingobacterium spiritivorum]